MAQQATTNKVKNNEIIIKEEDQTKMVQVWTNDLKELAKAQNFELSPKELEYGSSIIYGLIDKCVKEKTDINDLNLTNFLEQVKHFAKMELSMQEKEIFIDVRNNKNTGKKDVTLTKMYAGIQKLMTKYCKKKILRFIDGVVCTNDKFEFSTDFATGLTMVTKHEKLDTKRNDYFNYLYAYCIAYVDEGGRIVPYANIIDKTRLLAAYNASPSYDKALYKNYPERMARKTAIWTLYNDVMKPFIDIPSNLKISFEATEDEMDWNTPQGVDPNKTYDFDEDKPAKEEIIIEASETTTEDTNSILDGENKENSESDFEEVKASPATKEIWYSEYKENKDKYEPVDRPNGSPAYNEGTKKILVKLK